MEIRQLIDLLEQYEHDSDQGAETPVSITLNVHEMNSSGFNIQLPIDDVSIVYDQKDSVEFEITVTEQQIHRIQELSDQLNQLYIKYPHLSPQYIEEE